MQLSFQFAPKNSREAFCAGQDLIKFCLKWSKSNFLFAMLMLNEKFPRIVQTLAKHCQNLGQELSKHRPRIDQTLAKNYSSIGQVIKFNAYQAKFQPCSIHFQVCNTMDIKNHAYIEYQANFLNWFIQIHHPPKKVRLWISSFTRSRSKIYLKIIF